MNAVIVDAKRTIFGNQNGLLKPFKPEDLSAPIIRCLSRKLEDQVDEVILGNATGRGGNLARLSALQAGLPLSVPGMTIDRQCGSGLEAVRYACSLIQVGAGTMYIAGGSDKQQPIPFFRTGPLFSRCHRRSRHGHCGRIYGCTLFHQQKHAG